MLLDFYSIRWSLHISVCAVLFTTMTRAYMVSCKALVFVKASSLFNSEKP